MSMELRDWVVGKELSKEVKAIKDRDKKDWPPTISKDPPNVLRGDCCKQAREEHECDHEVEEERRKQDCQSPHQSTLPLWCWAKTFLLLGLQLQQHHSRDTHRCAQGKVQDGASL